MECENFIFNSTKLKEVTMIGIRGEDVRLIRKDLYEKLEKELNEKNKIINELKSQISALQNTLLCYMENKWISEEDSNKQWEKDLNNIWQKYYNENCPKEIIDEINGDV